MLTGGAVRAAQIQAKQIMESVDFNPAELCSRKLWQLVSDPEPGDISDRELSEAIAELARRRHYLEELEEMGKLEAPANH